MSYRASTCESRRTLEERRLEAEKDIQAGARQAEIVSTYGVTRTTASRWEKRVREGRSMLAAKSTGRPCSVDRRLLRVLFEGPRNFTRRQIQGLIFKETNVLYDIDHIGRLRAKFRASDSTPARGRE